MSRWPNKYVIGLTGNIAAGKSTVRKILQDLGAYGIDANELAHRAIGKDAPGYERLVRTFGESILDEHGRVDYEHLSARVQINPSAGKQLREIIQPIISKAVDLLVQHAKQDIVVIESTNLLEYDIALGCEAIWTVYATAEQRVARLMREHHLSETEAHQRIDAESPIAPKLRSADIVIFSDGSIERLRQKVEAAWSLVINAEAIDGAAIPISTAEEVVLPPSRPRPIGKKRRPLLDQSVAKEARSPLIDVWRTFRRNKAAIVSVAALAMIILMAVFAPWITPYDFDKGSLSVMYAKPMSAVTPSERLLKECHWAGTFLERGCFIHLAGSDRLGRDIWSRTIYGARVSLSVAGVAAATSLIIGMFIGTISGFAGGRLDEAIMRFVDFLYSLPIFMAAVVLQFFFRSYHWARYGVRVDTLLANLDVALGGLLFIFLAIGGLSWVDTARMARGQVYAFKQMEFIEAARVVGATNERIILRHLLPNIIGPLLVVETLAIPGYIFLEAALSFLGVGIIPPTPSWGSMIGTGYSGLRSHPHLVVLPSIAITVLTLSFNFIGDGLRDAFDTTLRGKV
ncbi:MAG: dephospho-CoA kinase [Anaerolineales bacterium]|nr:dephospho-CoA kinase [Anaerolineales bacterium]